MKLNLNNMVLTKNYLNPVRKSLRNFTIDNSYNHIATNHIATHVIKQIYYKIWILHRNTVKRHLYDYM
jgi:hypothetical protein